MKAFDGTLLFVSHDRYFIRALAGKILELENGKSTEFNGSYDEYTAYKQQLKKQVEHVPAPAISKNSEQKESYYRTKEERAQDAKRRTRVKKIEEEISLLEAEDAEINERAEV